MVVFCEVWFEYVLFLQEKPGLKEQTQRKM